MHARARQPVVPGGHLLRARLGKATLVGSAPGHALEYRLLALSRVVKCRLKSSTRPQFSARLSSCRAFNYSDSDAPLGSALGQPLQAAGTVVAGVGGLVTGAAALVPGSALFGIAPSSSKPSKRKKIKGWFSKSKTAP